jgi:ribosomal protein S18 acetylase RimI-like enzyme
VIVRKIMKGDYNAIRQIYRAIIEEYRDFLRSTGKDHSISPIFQEGRFKFYMGQTKSSFVAVLNGKVVGFILSQEQEWSGHEEQSRKCLRLAYIAVHPDSQRSGIGLTLLNAVKKYAVEHGLDELSADLNTNNEPSKKLLTRAGFIVKDWRIAFLAITSPTHEQD